MNYKIILGRNVQRLRVAAGMTPTQLGKALGLSANSINNMEQGILGRHCSVQHVFRLMEVFDCHAADLFQPCETPDSANNP